MKRVFVISLVLSIFVIGLFSIFNLNYVSNNILSISGIFNTNFVSKVTNPAMSILEVIL